MPPPPFFWEQQVKHSASQEELDETSRALVVLLQANPALAPHVASMGYLSKLLTAVAADRADLQRSAVQVPPSTSRPRAPVTSRDLVTSRRPPALRRAGRARAGRVAGGPHGPARHRLHAADARGDEG